MSSLSIATMIIASLLLLLYCVGSCLSFLNVYPRTRQVPVAGDVGEPLFLTPLIDAGAIEEARQKATVEPLEGDGGVLSYSGFITVNQTYGSNLFFWFFPAEVNNETAPVILWLNGGPGSSSLYGLFTENGPFYVNENLTLNRREYSWTTTHSVLFVDNPVGTGFSFTDSENGYARNEDDIAKDLYTALVQFFKLFPSIQKNDFFVTGESYAGKYIPAIAYRIHTLNPNAEVPINLKGIAIGNGICDPVNMLNYGDYLYQLGIIDGAGKNEFKELESLCVQYIQESDWVAAYTVFDQLLIGDIHQSGSLFYNLSGYKNIYHYLYSDPLFEGYYDIYVQAANVRHAIHVGNMTFHEGLDVQLYLVEDLLQSVKSWLEILLDNYRVLLYNGQLDIIVAYPLTLSYLQKLDWSASEEYRNATRSQWNVGNDLAGYVKTAGNLTEILVRNAGHMVPTDQPAWALDMLKHFTSNLPFGE